MIEYPTVKAGIGHASLLPEMDFETYSEAGYLWDEQMQQYYLINPNAKSGLEVVGMAAYAEHPSTEVLSLAYDLRNGNGPRQWIPGMPPPQDLFDHIARGGLIEAWNSGFEFYIWLHVAHGRMGWPYLPFQQLRCAMAKARSHGLPGKLEKTGMVLCLPEQKDQAGKLLINKLTKPRTTKATKKYNARRLTRATAPEDFQKFDAYNIQDIRAERAASMVIPDLVPDEQELWLLDQTINIRGVHVDKQSIDSCAFLIREATTKYNAELKTLTGGAVESGTEVMALKQWLFINGVNVQSLDAETVEETLSQKDIPANARRALEIRSLVASNSVKKLFAMQNQLCHDSRLRDLFAFCGADRTGRFAGRGPQPQNLYKGGPKLRRCEQCKACYWVKLNKCPECNTDNAFSVECEWNLDGVELALKHLNTRALWYVEQLWGDVFEVISGCLRSLFTAMPGAEFICSDYSAIEAVVLAVLAGEQWRIDVFRTHGKIYEATMATFIGLTFQEILDYKKRTGSHHPQRNQFGKIPELSSGYQGWIGAWKQFGADKYMSDEEIKQAILKWREASPAIVKFWAAIEVAAIRAVQNPGQAFKYRDIIFQCDAEGKILYCRLPSGRLLRYWEPQLHSVPDWREGTKLQLSYMGWNSDYKKGPIDWIRLETYGGKLTENIVQAAARDLLVHGMKAVERAGYAIVLHVHDEILAEVVEGTGSLAEFEKLMSTMPDWAADWPVKASGGWRGKRYRKE